MRDLGRPEAVIFDMDDTIVASAAIWRSAESQLLSRVGGEWSNELAMRYKGMNALGVASVIHASLNPTLSRETCQRILRDELVNGFRDAELVALPGAKELVQWLTGRVRLAVASGSPLVVIENAMQRLELHACFDALLSSEAVARGKPDPDIFLAAADRLGVLPAACLVIEDSLIGVQAAHAAGMRVVCVPSIPDTAQISQLADIVLPSLNDALSSLGMLFPD